MGGNDLDRSLEGHEGCYEIVRDFLVKQAEASIIHMTDEYSGAAMARRSEVEQARYQAGNRLIEAGIFNQSTTAAPNGFLSKMTENSYSRSSHSSTSVPGKGGDASFIKVRIN